MNIIRTANAIYHALKDDHEEIAKLRTARKRVAAALADPDKQMEVNSVTVNGQTFSGATRADQDRLLQVINAALAAIDGGAPISARTRRVYL